MPAPQKLFLKIWRRFERHIWDREKDKKVGLGYTMLYDIKILKKEVSLKFTCFLLKVYNVN